MARHATIDIVAGLGYLWAIAQLLDHLYITIGLSLCVTTGVALMDGRSRAEGTGGKMPAGIDGSGGGGGVAHKARGYKQGWADERAGRRAS